MVRLERVNKYFFRRRKNEIHVINNTSLSLDRRGLVALLGPSGCGKTTLLNVIGGLDRVDKGRVYINGKKITGRTAGRVDKIRTLNVGYIFQNYNLVENMTVFDNVAIALRMTGVTNKKEIENKVNYVLEKVGMFRYRNRYADMLSGGERQRVGIARAIVKNPAIIIADEPTGNLDSKNTLEVMNIIKSISEEKLVILVTHEEKLADFFATRIIRVRDGRVVSDSPNNPDEGLDYRIENKIYLKDIADHRRLKTDGYDLDFYNDGGGKLNLDIVLRNGNIYIKSNNSDYHVEIVDENSGIEFADEHYRRMTKEEAREKAIDLARLESRKRRRYRSILNVFTSIRHGFKTLFGYNTLKKILLAGFVLSAMFITYSVSSIFGVLDVDQKDYTTADESYITIVGKNIDVDKYLEYENSTDFMYIMPGDSRVMMELKCPDYMQTRDYTAYISGSLSDWGNLYESDMAAGRIPENNREIAIDKMVLQDVINFQDSVQVGLGTPESFIGRTISIENLGDLTITGVVDRETPCIYAGKDQFINIIACIGEAMDDRDMSYDTMDFDDGEGVVDEFLDYNLMKEKVKLKKGNWPEKDYEVMINDSYMGDEEFKLNKEINKKVNGHKLKIVGYYSDEFDSDFLLVNTNCIKYNLIKEKDNITACPFDKEEALSNLQAEGTNVKDVLKESRDKFMKEKKSSMKSSLIAAAVMLVISFVEIFLMLRASFLSRIREVGVYRAIGVKKRDIYKMFSGEIFAISTLAGLPGFALMAFVLWKISGSPMAEGLLVISPQVIAICLVLIFGLNFLFGLLPIWRIIRKRPAEILARTDIQ